MPSQSAQELFFLGTIYDFMRSCRYRSLRPCVLSHGGSVNPHGPAAPLLAVRLAERIITDFCPRLQVPRTMAPKRTLAEELAELATPGPVAGDARPCLRWSEFALDTLNSGCLAEGDFEGDELTGAATLVEDFDLEEGRQPSR